MKSLLIFLHGSGSNGDDIMQFLSIVPLGASHNYVPFREIASKHHIDIVAPTALRRSYDPSFGQESTVWFNRASDFLKCGRDDKYEDVEGANQSVQQLKHMIEDLEGGYDCIFLGGISMGGCCALHALRFDLHPKIRGIFSMGSFLVEKSIVFDQNLPLGDNAASLSLLLMHGNADSMIRHEWGQETATSLLLRGLNVRFESYDGLDHEIGEFELLDLLSWMLDLRGRDIDDNKGAKLLRKEEEAAQAWEEVDATSRQQPLPTVASTCAGAPLMGNSGVDFAIEIHPHEPNQATLRFPIPSDIAAQVIPLLTARPILACGGSFEIVNDPCSCGVMTSVHSSDPRRLGRELGRRMAVRISSGGGSLDACPMS